jgi:hypothetical protein
MTPLALQIDTWLRTQNRWVSAEEICERFGIVRDRLLRADGDRDGLLDDFAVSSSRLGFKHVRLLTTTEWIKAKAKMRRHGVREIRKTMKWDRARFRETTFVPEPLEIATGQRLLFPITPR